jgi:dTDP-4-dehydrorhamnose reductase
MKAIVVGAHGQLGGELIRLAPPDVLCIGLDRAELDITDPVAVSAMMELYRPDLVLNAAAYTAVDKAESEKAFAFAINAAGVRNLADAAKERGAHLLHVSTDFVFDGLTNRAYCPGDERNPLSVYGRSKAAGEDAIGSNGTVVRTSWLYGAGGSNFVTTMLRLMRERGEVGVVADQIGSPTLTTGLAVVIWRLGRLKRNGVWHHSDAGVASWYDFATAIAEEAIARGLLRSMPAVVPLKSAEYPTAAQRPKFSVLDSSETREFLSMPPVHWRTNLRRLLET